MQKLENKPYRDEDEQGEFIFEIDKKTGKKYPVKKLSGQVQPRTDMGRFYYLDAGQVKAIFDKLPLEIKQSFLDGLEEQMKDIATYDKDGEEAVAKIKNELAALA